MICIADHFWTSGMENEQDMVLGKEVPYNCIVVEEQYKTEQGVLPKRWLYLDHSYLWFI